MKLLITAISFVFICFVAQIRPDYSLGFSKGAYYYTPLLLILGLLSYRINSKRGFLLRAKIFPFFFACVVGLMPLFSSVQEAAYYSDSSGFSVSVVYFVLLFFVLAFARQANWVEDTYILYVSMMFLAVSLLHGMVAIMSYYGLGFEGVQQYGYIRLHGLTGSPNYFSRIIIPGILSSFFLFFTVAGGVKKIIIFVFGLFLIFVLLLTGSRGAMVAFFVSLFVFFIFKSGPLVLRILNTMLVTVFCSVLIFIVVLMSDNQLLHRKAATLESERVEIWSQAIEVFSTADFPQILIGHGNGFFSREYRSTHNVYLKILIDYGLAGFVLFAMFIVYIIINLFKFKISGLNRSLLLSGLVMVIVSGLFNQTIFGGSNVDYWFFIFLYGALFCRNSRSALTIRLPSNIRLSD